MKALLLILVCAGQVMAAGTRDSSPSPRVEVEIKAFREVKELKDGKERTVLEPVAKAKAGEIIVYSVSYRNRGGAPAKHAVLTDPLPRGVACLPETALLPGAVTEFSADGNATWSGLPLIKKERNAAGGMEEKAVPDAAITHVRWTLKEDLPPGGSGEIRFKARIK